MHNAPLPGVDELSSELQAAGWVTDLFVAGSAAANDYVPGVSDLDLFALVTGRVDAARQRTLSSLHAALDRGAAASSQLGCAYIEVALLHDRNAKHPTWTHGTLQQRPFSDIAKAQLVRHGYAVFGRPPQHVLPAMSANDVRRAARAELTGYWARATRRPWWWLDPSLAELGLSAMARGRHALATGELLTKTEAIAIADAPPWLIDRLQARRRGELVAIPRLPTAHVAWRDARRTTAMADRWRVESR